tara:strand:- start:1671 stop:2213 length:543 start_codon:yes stop_codon:yes gene_type:complete
MNCYNFELNISAYIEGNIQKSLLKNFIKHKDSCMHCKEKLIDISNMLENLPRLSKIKTSNQFSKKLQQKIYRIDNKVPSLWHKIINIRAFGLEPLPTLGMALSILLIFCSSYFLLNQDTIPKIDLNRLSEKNDKSNSKNYKPLIVPPIKNSPSMANSDTSINNQSINNTKIRLVGGTKGR